MIPPRFDVLASLHFTWDGIDLVAPVLHCIAIANAPSPTKDALSLGLLEGELSRDGNGLSGWLKLSDDGRSQVLALRQGWSSL